MTADRRPIYTLRQLASITEVPERRIRHWINRGLVQKAYPAEYPGEWQRPRYGKEHLIRIRKVQNWYDCRPTISDLAENIDLVGERALDIPDIYADD